MSRINPTVLRWTVAALAAVGLGGVGPLLPSADAAGALPACRYADTRTHYPRVNDWYRSLVDTDLRLPSSYAPHDLVPVTRSGAPGSGSIRAIALADLTAMFRAARAAGAPFAVESAYRSYHYQVGTFAGWVRRAGMAAARLASARPGHSEHQLGTSLDLTSPLHVNGMHVSGVGKGPWLYRDWGRTAAGAWLAKNAWRYGFVNSYPKVGSPSRTCYKYEPWHYRYVGRPVAAAIHASRLTPREWLWRAGATGTWTGWTPGSPDPAPPIEGEAVAEPPAGQDVGAAPPTDTIVDGPEQPSGRWGGALPAVVGVVGFILALVLPPARRRGPRLVSRAAPPPTRT
jgi:D-alanyl-D-alanine carboxypeptidase